MTNYKDKIADYYYSYNVSRWAKLGLYYSLLWSSVCAFWIVYMAIFQQTIDERVPKLILNNSPISGNPGLSIRPRPRVDKIDSSIINFRSSSSGDWHHWASNITDYLKSYQELESGAGQHAQGDCYGNRDPHKFCPFDLRVIPNECSDAQNYSYHLGKPCVLVKINKIYGWKPEPYYARPSNYPVDQPFREGVVQITCEGQSPADKDHIGPINYYPQGIDPQYFPYTNQPGYQSPFVMVHFKNPKPDVVIFVVCKAWANNIKHDANSSGGQVRFQLLID